MPHHQPSRNNCNTPQGEVHVDATVLGKHRDRLEAVAESLPRALCATQERRVSNDLGLVVVGEVLHDEVANNTSSASVSCPESTHHHGYWGVCGLQEEIVELESDGEEDKDPKTLAKASIRPVVRGLRPAEQGDDDRGPYPEATLKCDDDIESEPAAGLEGNVDAINPVLRTTTVLVDSSLGAESTARASTAETKLLTPRILPEMMAAIPPRKLPSALARTLNHTAQGKKSDLVSAGP